MTTLARLVARIRDRTAARLWKQLAALPDAGQRERLEALLVVPPEGRLSPMDRLRRGPTRMSARGLVSALQRLQEIRNLGIGKLDLRAFPLSECQQLTLVARLALLISKSRTRRSQIFAESQMPERLIDLTRWENKYAPALENQEEEACLLCNEVGSRGRVPRANQITGAHDRCLRRYWW